MSVSFFYKMKVSRTVFSLGYLFKGGKEGIKTAVPHLKGCCKGISFVEAVSMSHYVARIICTEIHLKHTVQFILFKHIISEIMESCFF